MRIVLSENEIGSRILFDIKCVDKKGREYPIKIVDRKQGYAEIEVPDNLLDKVVVCRLVLVESLKLPKKVEFKTIRLLLKPLFKESL